MSTRPILSGLTPTILHGPREAAYLAAVTADCGIGGGGWTVFGEGDEGH